MPKQPVILCALALLLAPLLAGCEYHLRGIVIEAPGGPATVSVVDNDDSRLKEEGLTYATLELTVDPSEHKPHALNPERTDGKGHFDIPISDMGAGFLTYKLEVIVHAEGHQPVEEVIDLPSGGKRLVVMLPAGRDNPRVRPEKDILKDTQDIGNELMK